MDDWYSRPASHIMKELESRWEGLTEREAKARLEDLGPNELAAPEGPGLLRRVLGQLKDPMILVLLGAAGLSLAASGGQDWLDGFIILVIVAVNAIISITQEDHAQQALEELRQMSAPKAKVMRDGTAKTIPARELVPGDVILLEAGDLVPADARILEAVSLQTDESAMTGESVPVEKQAREALPESTPLGDRVNMLCSGTLITAGRGTALVVATGMETEMGQIAGLLLDSGSVETPLQKKMGEISKSLSFLCLCVCGVMFGVGLVQGKDMLEMFLTAVSLAVAAIPEGLPAIVTIVLALGVQRLAARGAIVKKLPAVETLGCAGVICSDKTGTLTQNRMTLTKVWVDGAGQPEDVGSHNSPEAKNLLLCGALCCDGSVVFGDDGTEQHLGDPTETAILVAAHKNGLEQEQLRQAYPRVAEIPFDSDRKLMTSVHRMDGKIVVIVKGAFDVMASRCVRGDLQAAKVHNEQMSTAALRVLAVGYKTVEAVPEPPTPQALENGLTFSFLYSSMVF